MLKPRVIPCLLIQDNGLVKTTRFSNPKYIGDPINAVRIFNEKEADELIVLDIDATIHSRSPDYKLIARLAAECRMPLCYGGGIKSVEQAKQIIQLGVEKIAISSKATESPTLIKEIADAIGKQSVVVVLDIKKRLLTSTYDVWTHGASRNTKINIFDAIEIVQSNDAGEVVINFVDYDGTMEGYPLEMVQKIKAKVRVPFTVMGGASSLEDIGNLVNRCGIIGGAAGSLFVFKGKYRAVLINYPNQQQKQELIYSRL